MLGEGFSHHVARSIGCPVVHYDDLRVRARVLQIFYCCAQGVTDPNRLIECRNYDREGGQHGECYSRGNRGDVIAENNSAVPVDIDHESTILPQKAAVHPAGVKWQGDIAVFVDCDEPATAAKFL